MAKQERGSGLVEHVVALALLGILTVSLFGLLVVGSLAARSAQDHSAAASLAAQKLEQITRGRQASAHLPRTPFHPDRFPNYQWEADVAAASPGLERVTVTVSWLHRGRERSVTLTTLVRSPSGGDHGATVSD